MNTIDERIEEGIKNGEYVDDALCNCGAKMILKDKLHEVMRTDKYILYTSPYFCPECEDEYDIDEFRTII